MEGLDGLEPLVPCIIAHNSFGMCATMSALIRRIIVNLWYKLYTDKRHYNRIFFSIYMSQLRALRMREITGKSTLKRWFFVFKDEWYVGVEKYTRDIVFTGTVYRGDEPLPYNKLHFWGDLLDEIDLTHLVLPPQTVYIRTNDVWEPKLIINTASVTRRDHRALDPEWAHSDNQLLEFQLPRSFASRSLQRLSMEDWSSIRIKF